MADVDRRVSGLTTSRVEKRTTTVTKKRTTSESSEPDELKKANDRTRAKNYEINGLKKHDKKYVEVEESSEEESEEDPENIEIKPSVNPNDVARRLSEVEKDKVMICKICGKYVYQMEKIKAEKNFFHKLCFRCKECNKLLTVDSYSSHEGDIYCKLHFKQLFQPKVRFDDEGGPKRPRKHEMIIRENIPAELPPDVVRCNTKADDYLDNLNLDLGNIKSRFESGEEERAKLPSHTDMLRLERCDSVMLRLAKYQSAISGETNGRASSSDSDDDEERDPNVFKETRKREKVAFHEMNELKNQWEKGSVGREDKKDDIRDEVNKIRQRLCLGRSESMRAVYEKACNDAYRTGPRRSDTVNLGRDIKAEYIKQKFEKGDVLDKEIISEKEEKIRKEKEEDLSVFYDPGTAVTARNLFKQIDATAQKVQTIAPRTKSPSIERSRSRIYSPQTSVSEGEIVKCSEPTEKEEVQVETTEVSQKFKFFENFKEEPKERKRFQITPPREIKKEESPEVEIPRDPNVVRECDRSDDLPNTDTAKRMLSKFKALESGEEEQPQPAGPKPLKRITPPRDLFIKTEKREPSPEPERDPNIVVSSYKVEDDIVVEADKARILREKFEKWEAEMKKEEQEQNDEEEYYPQADTAKNLKAKFEAIKEEVTKPKEKPKPRVRRFI